MPHALLWRSHSQVYVSESNVEGAPEGVAQVVGLRKWRKCAYIAESILGLYLLRCFLSLFLLQQSLQEGQMEA